MVFGQQILLCLAFGKFQRIFAPTYGTLSKKDFVLKLIVWNISQPCFVFVSFESYNAIANGYRRLDCACDYGNEQEVGQGISRAIQDGLCKREDLFVTSKLWNTYHKPEHVPLAMKKTLADLALSYVDEYLIHFPISMEYGMYLV